MKTLLQNLPYVVAILATLVYIIAYVCTCKKLPELKNIVIILTSTVAIYLSIALMACVLSGSDEDLGILKDKKLLIIVGCFALLWVALISAVQPFADMKMVKSKHRGKV